jgi:hypothetical protein
MILERLDPTAAEFARSTGWEIKPEGACKAHVCVPLPASARLSGGRVDARAVAGSLGMGIAEYPTRNVWALGPESGGRALTSAVAPELTLPDRHGRPFRLGSLRGTKVFLCAWASW